jgi:hypothetical protein
MIEDKEQPRMGSIEQLAPIDPALPFAARVELIRQHWDRVLKFSHPFFSESGRWEASWMPDGNAAADTEAELVEMVRNAIEIESSTETPADADA